MITRLAALLLTLALLLSASPEHVRATGDGCPPEDPISHGMPPCCTRVDSDVDMPKRASAVEAEMMSDVQHEYVVFLDCWTGDTTVRAVGTRHEVAWSASLWNTSNALMLHSHTVSTMPSIADMQILHDKNPLEFRLIGFDHVAGAWSRCTFKKRDFRAFWPEINAAEYTRLKVMANNLFAFTVGSNDVDRWNKAYNALWSMWTAAHGVSMVCEVIKP